jgi:hypothetical protein
MPDTPRRHAVPAYFHPSDNPSDWSRLATSDEVGLVVANISDGPGIVREERWAAAFGGARAAGAAVVGYVDTGYLGLTDLPTRLGATCLDEWLEQILYDIETWYRVYGDHLTGIFFDQVAESDDGASLAPVLRRLGADVRHHDPTAVIVLNPGTAVPCSFADVADVIVTFEGTCEDYLAEGQSAGFEPLSWRPGPDQSICHMVHHTPNLALAREVVALSRTRGADLVYVTDNCGDNPYSSLPSPDVWAATASGRRGGRAKGSAVARWSRAADRRGTPPPRPISVRDISPDRSLIDNPTLLRTQHTIEASADFAVTSSSRRVFLASRRRHVPRWWTGSSPQIAADWMIENNRLYAYSGSGTDWAWTPSGQVTFEALGSRVRWRVEADRIGLANDGEAEAAFHVTAPGHREYSAVADV